MTSNVRGWVLLRGLLLPSVLSFVLFGSLAWALRSLGIAPPLVLVVLIPIVVAFFVWHYVASALLERRFDQLLFHGCKVTDLDPSLEHKSSTRLPILLINATALNSGEHLFFRTADPDLSPAALLPDIQRAARGDDVLDRQRRAVPLPGDTLLSRAVAASSAIPFAFPPVFFPKALDKVVGFLRNIPWKPTDISGNYWAIDGGVFDNQGTEVLLEEGCTSVIVSDGAAALRPNPKSSTWQLFPPGQGVLSRAFDITYEQARDLGYIRLEDRHQRFLMLQGVFRLLEELDLPREKAVQFPDRFKHFTPYIVGFTYVELEPRKAFLERSGRTLPKSLIPLVATIRTDLDRFSSREISALMYHGYLLINHSLSLYQPDWLPVAGPDLAFRYSNEGLFPHWDAEPDEKEVADAAHRLAISRSRNSLRRAVYRRWRNVPL